MDILKNIMKVFFKIFNMILNYIVNLLYNFRDTNLYLLIRGLSNTIYQIIKVFIFIIVFFSKNILFILRKIIIFLFKESINISKEILAFFIFLIYLIKVIFLFTIYIIYLLTKIVYKTIVFIYKLILNLPSLFVTLISLLSRKIYFYFYSKYYSIKKFNYLRNSTRLKKQIKIIHMNRYKKNINVYISRLKLNTKKITKYIVTYIKSIYKKIYNIFKTIIYVVKVCFISCLNFFIQIMNLFILILNYIFKFLISLKDLKVWFAIISSFSKFILLMIYKIFFFFYLCIKEIVFLVVKLPNIMNFIVNDIFKITSLYSWSLNNIRKSIFIIFVVFVVIIDCFLVYSNKDLLDKDNLYIDNSIKTPFMKIIQYGYYMINKETVLKVKHLTEKIYIVKRDELYDKLIEKNISPKDAKEVTKLLKKAVNFKTINSSSGILLSYTYLSNWDYNRLDKLTFLLNDKENLIIENDNDNYSVKITDERIIEYVLHKKIRIENSVNESILNEGVPSNIERIVTKSLSWGLDFVREVHDGDNLDIVYTCNYNKFGKVLDCSKVLYVSFRSSEKTFSFYNYKNNYYYTDGKSVSKLLIKTPLDQTRLTSSFGVRLHPVLGYSVFHTGNDFGGRVGTPIYASGDGVIVKAYFSESYGLYVTIKHNEHLRTAYAHLSRFAPDIKVGTVVKQFQVIGYIGSTGRATGPHLHYEVWIDNKAVNSLTIDTPSKNILSDEELIKFTAYKKLFDDALIRIPYKVGAVVNAKKNLPEMPE